MIADVLLLADLRIRLAWNTWTARRRWQQVLVVLGALWLAGAVGGLASLFGFGLGRVLRGTPEGLDALVPAFVLTAVALILLFSSFGLALSTLYFASDLDLLMTAPVDRRAVFLVKLLEGLSVEYAITGFTALPALVAYGWGQGYAPPYVAAAVGAVLAAPLLPASLGALLVLAVARVAPVRRIRDVLAVAGAILGISLGLIGQTGRFWSERLDPGSASFTALLQPIAQLIELPVPTFFGGRGLAAVGNGDWAAGTANLAIYFALTVGLFGACLWLAGHLYAAGWVRLQSAGVARRAASSSFQRGRLSRWSARWPVPLALATKDWRVIRRDPRYAVQLLAPLIFLPVIYFNLVTGGGARSGGAFRTFEGFVGDVLDPAGAVIAAGILIATITFFAQIASTGISLEGQAWWLLRSAPLDLQQILLSKLLVTWLPFAVVSTAVFAVVAVWRGFGPAGALYGWFGIEVLGGGMLVLATGLAVPWARLDWDNPKQMNSTWGVLFTYLGMLLIGSLAGGLLCLPLLAQGLAPHLTVLAWAAGAFGALAVTAVLAGSAWRFGLARLGRVGEPA